MPSRDRKVRRRAIGLIHEHGTRNIPFISNLCGVAKSTLFVWWHEFIENGTWEPHDHRHDQQQWSILDPDSLFIALSELDQSPMLFLDEIQRTIEQCTGYRYSLSQIHEAIFRQGYTHKVLEYRAMEQNANLRTLYRATIALHYTASQLVYFDETHSQPKDFRRRYGYGMRGLPAFANVRNLAHGKGKSAAAACALALDGMMAVRVTEGKMNAEYISTFIIQDVIPEMQPFPGPRSVLVMDNASVHNIDEIADLLQARGMILVLLPPYSYDYNPIEFSFHEAKASIRREYGLEDHGQVPANQLIAALTGIGAHSAINYYQHCGIQVSQYDRAAALQGIK